MGLTISGHISGVTGSELTKQGVGSLALTNDNSVVGGGFSGPFSIDNSAGIVELTNANALGATSTSEVQTLTLSGLTTGKFNLKFNGSAATADLDYASTAAQVQAALNGLATIAPGTGQCHSLRQYVLHYLQRRHPRWHQRAAARCDRASAAPWPRPIR